MSAQHILVYGGSGVRGLPIVRQLLAQGTHVRALATSEPEAQTLRALGAEAVLGTLDDPASLRHAHQGIEAVFLHLPISSGAQHAQNAIDAAQQAGVDHLVFTTNAPVPPAPTTVPNIELMREVEASLRAIGVPSVILRPMFYMENFAGPWTAPGIATQGVVAYPVPSSVKVPWLSVEDAAKLAVEALGRPDLAGRSFDIGGPQQLDGSEVADQLTHALGRPIRYHAVPLDEFEAGLNAALGAPAGTEVTKLYRWLAEHPLAGAQVDMSAVFAHLPVPLTTLATWARGRDEFHVPASV